MAVVPSLIPSPEAEALPEAYLLLGVFLASFCLFCLAVFFGDLSPMLLLLSWPRSAVTCNDYNSCHPYRQERPHFLSGSNAPRSPPPAPTPAPSPTAGPTPAPRGRTPTPRGGCRVVLRV